MCLSVFQIQSKVMQNRCVTFVVIGIRWPSIRKPSATLFLEMYNAREKCVNRAITEAVLSYLYTPPFLQCFTPLFSNQLPRYHATRLEVLLSWGCNRLNFRREMKQVMYKLKRTLKTSEKFQSYYT